MAERVLEHGTEEREGWKQILSLLEQENILQKNRLAEMLKAHENEANDNLVEIAERYQSQFLQQDDTLRIMWNDLTGLERSIAKEASKPGAGLIRVNNDQEKLRQEMKSLQVHFNQLKAGFTNFFEAFAEQEHQHK